MNINKEQAVSDAMLRAARAVADGVDDSAFERIYLAMKAASHPPDARATLTQGRGRMSLFFAGRAGA